jgi:hypothetical protein
MLPTGVTPSSSFGCSETPNKFSGTRLVWWELTSRYCLSMALYFAARKQFTAHVYVTWTFHLTIFSSTRTLSSNSNGYVAVPIDQSTWHTDIALLTHVPSIWSQLRVTDEREHRHCSYTDGPHSQEVGGLWFETQATLSRRAAGPTKTCTSIFIENSLSAFTRKVVILRVEGGGLRISQIIIDMFFQQTPYGILY